MGSDEVHEHWETRYRESDRLWSGNPNRVLVDVFPSLAPGRAVDLGCGEGADAVWLAAHGWHVTAVDASATAIDRGRSAADAAGLGADAGGPGIDWVVADLGSWEPPTGVDLVTAFFLHSSLEGFDRTAVLRRAAAAVAPGGHLLVVGHAAPPPWLGEHAHHHGPRDYPAPAEALSELALPRADWEVEVAEVRSRTATGPDGLRSTLDDSVLLLRRR